MKNKYISFYFILVLSILIISKESPSKIGINETMLGYLNPNSYVYYELTIENDNELINLLDNDSLIESELVREVPQGGLFYDYYPFSINAFRQQVFSVYFFKQKRLTAPANSGYYFG